MSQNASKPEPSPQTLPLPVTANADSHVTCRIDIKQSSVASAVVALSVGFVAVSPNQPKATLLFVGASIVAIVLCFTILPSSGEQTDPLVTTFLRWLPNALTAIGSVLIMLGIGFAFPDRALALVSLYAFAFFAGLPALKVIEIGPRITAILYGISLVSLVPFVVLVCAS